jgi:hypothetical protein
MLLKLLNAAFGFFVFSLAGYCMWHQFHYDHFTPMQEFKNLWDLYLLQILCIAVIIYINKRMKDADRG